MFYVRRRRLSQRKWNIDTDLPSVQSTKFITTKHEIKLLYFELQKRVSEIV